MSQELLQSIQSHLDNPMQEVDRIETIVHADFYKYHLKKGKPVVITRMVENWNASKTWSLDYFRKIGKDKAVYLAKDNIFQGDANWEQGKFSDFIDRIDKNTDPNNVDYLLDIPLLKLFPELKNDIDFSLISNHKVRDYKAIWIGTKGTLTGWHTDRLADNILAQIQGRKLVLLVHPSESKYMYPSKKYEPGSKISLVDMKKFDDNEFSLFKNNAHVSYTVLDKNEMIFIPKEWWHCVYGLELSISTNNFGFSFVDNIRMKSDEFIKRHLHKAGLYGKDHVRTYKK